MKNDTHFDSEQIFPADPRVTAYAFGELEGEELARMEAAVKADPALQAAVAELRGFGAELEGAFAAEPVAESDGDANADTHEAEEIGDEHELAAGGAPTGGGGFGGWVAKLPSFYYLAGGMAAAGFAVMVAMNGAAERSAARGDAGAPVVMEMVEAHRAVLKQAPSSKAEGSSQALVSDPLVKFEIGSGSSVVSTPASEAKDAERMQLSNRLNAKGRREYLAGDISGAEETFKASLAIAPESPEARSFQARIAKEQARIGELNRTRTRTQMVMEVSSAWQRPLAAVPAASASVGGVVGAEYLVSDYADARAAGTGAVLQAEAYSHPADNAFLAVAQEPLSTFSIDVDTASYANVRRFLSMGVPPPRDAVRIEELINYFPYRYTPPPAVSMDTKSSADLPPFAAQLEVATAPWANTHRLVRVGIKGRELTAATRAQANIVFLLDVSGSMNEENKLPLVKEGLRLLVERLRPDDRVAIVTYAGNSGLALPSTPAARKSEILGVLDSLAPGGSTNGAMGIHLAYDIAKANFVPGGVNRVILCTDGDFNVGVTSPEELVRLIEEKAKSRVFLSVFGFGMGNLKDSTLESLADKGNGAYGYIDSRREAEKVFVEQLEGTLSTIAKDVKIQVEFNPAQVASYRLIGYENRLLKKEDFNNDAIDAGEIGAGHTVTALYEIVPVGATPGEGGEAGEVRTAVDPLKYQPVAGADAKSVESKRRTIPVSRELLTVKIRYKAPEGDVSRKLEFPLVDRGTEFAKASADFRFAASVAAWGMILRDSPYRGSATFNDVLGWAEGAMNGDAGGYRAEFLQLVRRSAELKQGR